MKLSDPWVWTKNNVYPKGRWDCKHCGVEMGASTIHKEFCLWAYATQLEAENEALREYFHAHIAVEVGLATFDLHNEAVDRLEKARDAVVVLLTGRDNA